MVDLKSDTTFCTRHTIWRLSWQSLIEYNRMMDSVRTIRAGIITIPFSWIITDDRCKMCTACTIIVLSGQLQIEIKHILLQWPVLTITHLFNKMRKGYSYLIETPFMDNIRVSVRYVTKLRWNLVSSLNSETWYQHIRNTYIFDKCPGRVYLRLIS